MSYTLSALASDIRSAIEAHPGRAGREKVREHVVRALKDPAFVAENLSQLPSGSNLRKVLYEDPKTNAVGNPHDHGTSWAVYGQATGVTEMTDWKVVEKGDGEKPTLVEPERVYNLEPGDAHLYDVGFIHSPRRMMPSRLIRIEGANLDHVKRSRIKAKS
jgi:hypothetical protein